MPPTNVTSCLTPIDGGFCHDGLDDGHIGHQSGEQFSRAASSKKADRQRLQVTEEMFAKVGDDFLRDPRGQITMTHRAESLEDYQAQE